MTTTHADYGPLDDDYETEILPLRRRPRLPVLTALLAVAAIIAVAFVGGVEIQKHYGGSSASPTAASAAGGGGAFAGRRRGGAGGAGGRAPGGATGGGSAFATAGGFGGAGTAGLVTLIKGSTLYVTDFSGNTIKVSTAGAKVTKTVVTKLNGVHPGDSVVVRGSKQKNGTYKASSITINSGG
jgi:hypothetical protein